MISNRLIGICILTLVTLMFTGGLPALAIGFAPSVEVKTVQTNASKCLYEEFTNAIPPLIKVYAKRTTETETASAESGTPWVGIYCFADPEIGGLFTNCSITSIQEIATTDKQTCEETNVVSGSSYSLNQVDDNRHVWCNNGNCTDEWWYMHTLDSSQGTVQWVEIGSSMQWGWVNQNEHEFASDGYNYCPGHPVNPYGTNQSSTTTTNAVNYPPTFSYGPTTETPTHRTYELDPPPVGGTDVTTIDLEDEFTTDELMAVVESRLPPWPDWADTGGGPISAWTLADCTERDGAKGKAKIKVRFQTKKGRQRSIPYVLKYQVLRANWKYVDSCTNMMWTTNIMVMRHQVEGTGGIVEIELPELVADAFNSSKVASKFWVFTPRRGLPNGTLGYDEDEPYFGGPPEGWEEFDEDDVPDDEDDDDQEDDDGGGGTGGDDGDDCGSCNDGDCEEGFSAASLRTESGTAAAAFYLGSASSGESAGSLRFWNAFGGELLSTPAALAFDATRHDVEVVMKNDILRQIKAPQGLADVTTNSAQEYQIKFYQPSSIGSKVGGIYQLSGAPVITYTILNPDGTNEYRRLWMISTKGGVSVTNVMFCDTSTWSADGTLWMNVGLGNGQKTNRTTTSWDTTVMPPARKVRGERFNVGAGTRVQAKEIRYEANPAGDDIVVSRQSTASTNIRDTIREYYPSSTPPGYVGRLKKRIDPDGQWSYYEYEGTGRVVREVSGFLNQGYTTDTNLCRSVVKDYTMLPPEYGSSYSYNDRMTPRLEVEYLLGKEIRRTYRVELEYESRLIVCQTPEAAWDATDNLVTITKLYSTGDWQNELASVENPDGTMSFYSYATNSAGYFTNTVSSGLPNGGKTDVTKGTRTTTVIDPTGQTLSTTTVDIASGLVTGQTISSNPDSVGRYQKLTYLDNTFTWTTYGCCGVETVTNRDGSVTSYDYDSLGRKSMESTDGITKFNYYDSAGRLYSVVRQGTNGNQITLFTRGFDAWGRVIRETNAMLNVTSWAYLTNAATGGNLVIQTNADTGTIIQTYAIDGTLLKTTGTGVHPSRTDYGVEQDGSVWRSYSKEIKLDAAGTDTGEWVKHYSDLVGRSYKAMYPDGATNVSYFNSQGEPWKHVDADGIITLTTNHNFNEQYSVVDMDRDSVIDWTGSDRIHKSVSDVTASSLMGGNVRRTRSYVYASDGSSAETLVGTSETSVDGLKQWSMANGVTNKSQTVYAAGGYKYVTNTAPDGAYAVSVSQKGRQLSETQKDALNAQLLATTYGYDAHGRMNTVTDARNGTTTFTFNNGDQIVTTTTPVPGAGQSAQVTTSYYDNMDRVWRTVLPDYASVTNEYYLTGELKRNYGSRVYPTGFGYDTQGRMKTMTNWSGFGAGTGLRVTTWNYDSQRGWLNNKRYPDNTGPDYTYKPSGLISTRTWARGTPRLMTTYSYNNAGEQSLVDYADGTPDASFNYDRLGRMTNVVNGAMTTTLYVNTLNQFLGESYSGGVLNGLHITNSYDALLRRTTNGALNGSTWLGQMRFGYDAASRLKTVSAGTNTAAYSYLANSPLVENVWFTNGSTLRMTTTKQYDYLNRLKQISSVPSAASALTFNYAYNAANQRTAITNADNSRWVYQYDTLGQVTSGKRYWSDNTPVAGQQFEYGFDDIGNRNSTASGGDQYGANLRYAGYTNNTLNQITGRSVPGYLNVIGTATNTATVTVNNQATYRRSNYFRVELATNNANAPVWLGATNLAVLNNGSNPDIVSSVTGTIYVAKSPEIYTYDLDGNLTSDGRWTNRWDAENRLIEMEAIASVPSTAKLKLAFIYDQQGRRIQKVVSSWNGSTYVAQSTNRFVYDGWNLIAELDHTNGVIRTCMWGLDLSRSEQGAGGVGGLLQITQTSLTNAQLFCAYDGNGNVMALVGASNGTVLANYEYAPFGEVIRASGVAATTNPFRFSTKYQDAETGLLYYGYRSYDPSTGRWLAKDPAGEMDGGLNLYAYTQNNALDFIDLLGLQQARFENVVGDGKWTSSGKWSAPDGYGSGSSSTDGKTQSSTTVSIWNAGAPKSWLNTCNTVSYKNYYEDLEGKPRDVGNAGSIFIWFQAEPGTYVICIDWKMTVSATGPEGRSTATLWDDAAGNKPVKSLFANSRPPKPGKPAPSHGPSESASGTYTVTVTVTSNSEVRLMRYVPAINYPVKGKTKDNIGNAEAELRVKSIKKKED